MNFDLLLKCYRGDVFREWLADARGRGFGHGSALVEALGAPCGGRPGMTDNVRAAEKILEAAVTEGWLLRCGGPSPTPQQRFFNVAAAAARSHDGMLRGATECGYTVVDCGAVRAFLAEV